MDQYSPAIVTVPANMSSVKMSQLPHNGTSLVANREYTITVSAINDQGTSYPSNPVVISKFAYVNMKNICTVIIIIYEYMIYYYNVWRRSIIILFVQHGHMVTCNILYVKCQSLAWKSLFHYDIST